jgi:transposase InsO family protein
MPWKVADVMGTRIEFLVKAAEKKESFSELCQRYRISRMTGYRWVRRLRETGSLSLLEEKSRKPHRSPGQTSAEVEKQVVDLRSKTGWGARKLSHVLLRDSMVLVPAPTAHRILRRHGCITQVRPQPVATCRFEREEPNELWQMDFKGHYLTDWGVCHPLSILDDCSRYAVGLFARTATDYQGVSQCLIEVLMREGVPESILTDHGSPWWSTTNGHGLTRLSVEIIKQGIELTYSRIRHPQTQGKVERFHRTLSDYVKHKGRPETLSGWQRLCDEFRLEYNQVRPHEAVDMDTPADRYRPSVRTYNPNPADWQYPPDALVRRLNKSGTVRHGKNHFFVCEALAGEPVWLRQVDDKILVTYRHMYIRELDVLTGKSTAMLGRVQQPAQTVENGRGLKKEKKR